jgi:hypothetical protein
LEADASLSAQALPPPLNNCVVFFEYCVRHKVICVPGIFFDVNPFHRRRFHKSPYIDKLRMSYGRGRVAQSQTSSQGHEGDHRASEGGAATPSRGAAEGLKH